MESTPTDVSSAPSAYYKPDELPLLVFDIETIPDIELIKSSVLPVIKWDRVPEENQDWKGKLDTLTNRELVQLARWHFNRDFLPLLLHKVLCIGWLIRTAKEGKVFKGMLYNGTDEKKTMEQFATNFNRLKPYPRVLTFNGKQFDMPVVALRMMKYGIKQPVLWETGENCKDFMYNRKYTNKYDHTKHLDISDILVHFAYMQKPSLNMSANFLGVPTKSDGMCGSDVMDYHYDGRDKEICNYCMQDVIVTYHVFLKYLYTATFMTQEEYNARVAAIPK